MSDDKCPKPEEKNVYGTNADGTPYAPKPRGFLNFHAEITLSPAMPSAA